MQLLYLAVLYCTSLLGRIIIMSHTTCRKQKVQYAFPALDGDGGVIINNYNYKKRS